MIYINHELKAIFIHIPKTGGSYVGTVLEKYYGFTSYLQLLNSKRPDHNEVCNVKETDVKTGIPRYDNSFFNKVLGLIVYAKTSRYMNHMMNMNDEKWTTYTKFCFVRNIYSRLYSGWNHIKQVMPPTALCNRLSLEEYLNLPISQISNIEYVHVFMPQSSFMEDENGNCFIDIIGKFETLENDFVHILRKIGITKIIHKKQMINASKNKGRLPLPTNKLITTVNRLFRKDHMLLF